MAVLFLPRPQTFNGNTAAGSGNVSRWTYTVPAGKRAVLADMYLQVNNNANAVNTTACTILCTISAVAITVFRLDGSGVATIAANSRMSEINLQGGDTVQGFTNNAGANIVAMVVNALIREFQ